MRSDSSDYDSLVRPIEDQMIRSVWRIVRDPDDAEDAFQEATAKIWKRLRRIRRHPNPQALILKICTDSAYDVLRRRLRQALNKEQESVIAALPDPEPSAVQHLISHETQAEIFKAIGQLSPKQGTAVLMRFVHGLTTLRKRMETTKSEKRPSRIFSWRTALRYATPAAALTLIFFICYLIISVGDFSRVYAAVKQLRKAHTLTYSSISQQGNITTEQEIIFKEPHFYRHSSPDGSYTIQNLGEHKELYVSPTTKQYIETVYNFQVKLNVPAVIDQMRSLPLFAKKIPGERELDGHNVRGFLKKRKGFTNTFWIDTETHELVQMERQFHNTPENRQVIKNIRFDIEYPDSFFSLEPPFGFTGKKKTTSPLTPINEQDLINVLDFLTLHNVDSIFPETWNYNDMSSYMIEFTKPDRVKTDEEIDRINKLFNRGYGFVLLLEPGTWHYAGKGVKRGEEDTPIFWYKPNKPFWASLFSKTYYRVIYADLTVHDVAPEYLPSIPAGKVNDQGE